MEYKIKKGDMVIVLVAVLFFGIAFLFFRGKTQGEIVIVSVNGEETEYPLAIDREIQIKGEKEHYNVIQIKEGQVKMSEADCQDQICVKHKAICKNGEMIICLPNEVVIQVEGGEEKEVDN